ncbi:MAG: GNAT family N-acetyltransferase [Eubacteriales bacterium]|nr:GNAT family N-acetyltransferase [Eubacteriales bacterium]
MEYRRTNGHDCDFIENCRLLDQELDRRVGKEVQDKQYRVYNQIDSIEQAIVVYQDDRPIAGGAIKRYSPDSAELKRIFVQPDWQRQGIGKELVIRLTEWARELGYQKLVLESAKALSEAHALYRRHGFEGIPNYGPYKGMDESLCMAKMIAK